MIICDTNIFIEVYRGNLNVIEIIKQIGQENIAVSDVTCAELLYGARNKKELNTIRKDLNNITILSINSEISKLSVELVEKYSISHKISLPDALIGATSIYHNIELYTHNTKDFKFLENIKLFVEPK